MNAATYIGLRFSFSTKESAFLSFITKVSVIGLSLGVMALVVVVSVMNGFDSQLKYRILGAAPHMVLAGELPDSIKDKDIIAASARFQQREGVLIEAGNNKMVAIYGIDPLLESNMSNIAENMTNGSLEQLIAGKNRIILGAPLSSKLGLWLGDKSKLLIPEPSVSGNSVVPKFTTVEMAGTFVLQSELDYSLVLMHIDDLQKLTGDHSLETRIRLKDLFAVGRIRKQLPTDMKVRDWADQYGDFFETVRMEKMMMFILLTLIVMIAAFNTISGLSMMVKEKQAEIAVLRTMGMSKFQVMKIFIVQGSVIGIGGTLLGLLMGIPLAFNVTEVISFFEALFGNKMLSGTYFDRVPTDVRWLDIAAIILVSFLISIAATLFPAYRAARIEPAQVLRAE